MRIRKYLLLGLPTLLVCFSQEGCRLSTYFLALFFLILMAMLEHGLAMGNRNEGHSSYQKKIPLAIAFVFLAILIGFRHEVGGDWDNYLDLYYLYADNIKYGEGMDFSNEVGFQLINFIVYWLGGNIYFVNLLAAIISLAFLMAAINRWKGDILFGLICAFPYLLMVMLMGYTRQGIAACIVLYAMSFLRSGQAGNYLLGLLLAMQFHTSAILLLPLMYSNQKLNGQTLLKFLGVCLLVGSLYLYFSGQSSGLEGLSDDSYYSQNYLVEESVFSQGVFQRIAIVLFGFMVFFIFRKKFVGMFGDERIFLNMFFFFVALVSLLFLDVPTTPVDRILLYVLSFSMIILARVPAILGQRSYGYWGALTIFSLISFAQLYVWLSYAYNASAWLPYQNWLFL